jgi:hypothetical protein
VYGLSETYDEQELIYCATHDGVELDDYTVSDVVHAPPCILAVPVQYNEMTQPES